MSIRRVSIVAVAFALFMTTGGCDLGSGVAPNPADALYVCNQAAATISIVDPETHEVVRTVDLAEKGFSSNPKPHHVVVEPDGSAWYVSLIGDNLIVKFSDRNRVLGTVEFPVPGMMSLDPDRQRGLLYVGHTMSIPDVPRTVALIDRHDMTRLDVLSVPFDRPHGVKVSPTGRYAYVSSLSTNEVVAIDTETKQVHPPVSFAGEQQRYVQMDITADGSRMYLTGQFGDEVHVLRLDDPTAPVLTERVDVGAEPWHPQLSNDGSTLYVGSKATNTVYSVDTQTLSTSTIEGDGLAQPHGSALSPDGRFLYVSNTNVNGTYEPESGADVGTVVAIDTRTEQIVSVIEVGEEPAGINTRWRP